MLGAFRIEWWKYPCFHFSSIWSFFFLSGLWLLHWYCLSVLSMHTGNWRKISWLLELHQSLFMVLVRRCSSLIWFVIHLLYSVWITFSDKHSKFVCWFGYIFSIWSHIPLSHSNLTFTHLTAKSIFLTTATVNCCLLSST